MDAGHGDGGESSGGGWFRSEEMVYVSVILQRHVAHNALGRIGDLGAVQFQDLNTELTAFQRRYTSSIRRCDELERILRFFESEMAAVGIVVTRYDMHDFNNWRGRQLDTVARQHTQMTLLDAWEADLKRLENELTELKSAKAGLLQQYVRLVEREKLLSKAHELMSTEQDAVVAVSSAERAEEAAQLPPAATATRKSHLARYGQSSPSLLAGHRGEGALDVRGSSGHGSSKSGVSSASGMRFKHLAGVMRSDDHGDFVRLLRRVSRGNCYVQFAPITEPMEDEKGNAVSKCVFIIFFRAQALERKLRRLCDAFDAHLYPVPSFDQMHEVKETARALRHQIDEVGELLQQNRHMSELALENMSTTLDKWQKGVRREKAIYHTLNMFSSSMPEMLQGRGWVLAKEYDRVVAAVQAAHSGSGVQPAFIQTVVGDWPTPPTYFRTNKFTGVFQEVVDTYGVPRYQEANPALFTAVTFPFLFAIMYGDAGHATLLFIFSAALVIWEKRLARQKLNELVGMAFAGRYMLLLMGFFSIYCGIVYNDMFSLPLQLFESRWEFNQYQNGTAVRVGGEDDVYPFGVDSAWHRADNGLLFFNSLKMKISVVFGVVQMSFGIILKMTNAVHFKSNLDLYFECLPQLLFMLSLFGYMLFLIFFKWSIDWNNPPEGAEGAPPSLVDTLIGIVLSPGSVVDAMFEGQAVLQVFLLLIVFFSVPVMLLTKPLVLRYRHNQSTRGRGIRRELGDRRESREALAPGRGEVEMKSMGHDPPATADLSPPPHSAHKGDGGGGGHGGGGHGGGHGEEFDFVEIMMHQAIETIEFVLGTVSNTASYLRLWALSLAHSELAEVFWEKAMVSMIDSGNPVAIFIGYAAFAGATFGVLCAMDVLECFLHALRLHWVEFQNKFFRADGYKFQPFHFSAILNAA